MSDWYDKIEADWAGEPVFVVAGGPSVLLEDLSTLQGYRVICVNSAYETLPFADACFFADKRWWVDHMDRQAMRDFKGTVYTVSLQSPDSTTKKLVRLRRKAPTSSAGLSLERGELASMRTSTQGAINLALHKGASLIVLLGVDMGRDAAGRTHHHSPHRWDTKPGNAIWDLQMEDLKYAAATLRKLGVDVVNTSMTSRIDWWPKRSLKDVIHGLRDNVRTDLRHDRSVDQNIPTQG